MHGIDVRDSSAFLDALIPKGSRGRALDCGAGIGRVSTGMLVPAGFKTVDVQDIVQSFIDQAVAAIPDGHRGVGYCSSLQLSLIHI